MKTVIARRLSGTGVTQTALAVALLSGAFSSVPALAQDIPADAGIQAPATAEPQAPEEVVGPVVPLEQTEEEATEEKKTRFFLPVWADKAEERGVNLPRPVGAGVVYFSNDLELTAKNLAINVAATDTGIPTPPTNLIDIPQVDITGLRNEMTGKQFKVDAWLFPFLNLFVTLGEVHGDAAVSINIDLDELLPFPICRPAKPCGVQPMDFKAHIDNKTTTLGMLAIYGSGKWFMSASVAKTLSIAKSSERSDVESTYAAARTGVRFPIKGETYLSPYVGAGYYDLETQLEGVVYSSQVLPDNTLGLRYRVDMHNTQKWSAIAGLNLEVSRLLDLHAEYNKGDGSERVIASATFRFF